MKVSVDLFPNDYLVEEVRGLHRPKRPFLQRWSARHLAFLSKKFEQRRLDGDERGAALVIKDLLCMSQLIEVSGLMSDMAQPDDSTKTKENDHG